MDSRFILHALLIAGVSCAVLSAGAQDKDPAQERAFFENKVRPVLAEHCYGCHGPEKQKASLRLDHIQHILQGGDSGPALMPGDLKTSRLIEAIRYTNVDFQMPPRGKLPEDAINALETWIAMGAPWPEEALPADQSGEEGFDLDARRQAHWAWKPVQNPPTPKVENAAWARSDVDRFILARLEEAKLTPAAEADRRTLIRRLSFDLTGLPPTPDAVAAFVADTAPDAYEKVVDALLASPHFGERWGRHWLDLTRFAETYGHEQDFPIPHAWRYRDYVIRAFNDDLPYDQLIREHIAGDLLPEPRRNPDRDTNESVLATGFWYMHQATHAPVDVLQDNADRIDNQIDVLSKTFLGMTVACARCHDHKFDAISAEDYYALAGYFRSSRQSITELDPGGQIAVQRAALLDEAARGRDALQAAAQQVVSSGAYQDIARYLIAANDVLYGRPEITDGAVALQPDILFEDFESGTFRRWLAEGRAFADGPSQGPHKAQDTFSGMRGAFFANSYGGSDSKEGRLASPPFIIERSHIRFLISGGAHEDAACMNLRIGDAVVRTATGQNSDALAPVVWDVSEFAGKTAVIEIVDAATAEWGHVLVDHIAFSNSAYPTPLSRPPAAVAAAQDLDVERLKRWVDALQREDRPAPDHPLFAWNKLAAQGATDETTFTKTRDKLVEENPADFPLDPESQVLFEDFDTTSTGEWYPDGFAFTGAPTASGDWLPARDGLRLTEAGTAHSGLIAGPLHGTLRSRDFIITHERLHFRAAGEGGKLRLVIGGYQLRMNTGLLYEGTLLDVNTGGAWRWHSMVHGVGKFVGKKAYIEIIDDNNGWVAVDEIVFSNGDAPGHGAGQLLPALAKADGSDWVRSPERLAKRYAFVTRDAFAGIAEGTADAGELALASWLLENRLIDLGDAGKTLMDATSKRWEIAGALAEPIPVLAMTEGTPTNAPLFIRGNPKNPAEPVERRFLEALASHRSDPPKQSSGRLALAESIAHPDNPLTARVMANRIWHHLFGRGLVPSVDNFGVLGQPPSHPELLDRLASDFVAKGWSVKQLIRELVTTQTYRMGSAHTDAVADEQDPANILLHRMPLRRLEGEAVRDAILAAAGTLDDTMYGPSVPAYLSPFAGQSRRPPSSGPMDGDRRRTIYLEVRRNFLNLMLLAFDLPLPDSTLGRRTVSNLPAQSLILMNDPFVVEQAQAWSARILEAGDAPAEARIAGLYETALGRPPSREETTQMAAFLEDQRATYGLSKADAKNDAQLWTDACHVMFMLKEFIFVG